MPVSLAIPVVTPPGGRAGADPVAFAVPNVLVPGVVGAAAAFPTPLGSLTVLLSPPGDAGPFGTPLVAAEPAPADPAFGVAVAVPVPADEPLAAPPVEAPPPADDPPPPPGTTSAATAALSHSVKGRKQDRGCGLVSQAAEWTFVKSPFARSTPCIEWLFRTRQQFGKRPSKARAGEPPTTGRRRSGVL